MGLALELDVGESLWIGESQLFVEKVGERKVRVRINAPKNVPIVRDELKRRNAIRKEADHAQP